MWRGSALDISRALVAAAAGCQAAGERRTSGALDWVQLPTCPHKQPDGTAPFSNETGERGTKRNIL